MGARQSSMSKRASRAPDKTEHFEADIPAAFTEAYRRAKERAAALGAPLFIHVRASWCPDCRRSDGRIRSAIAARDAPSIVLTAQVPDPGAYRMSSFPYRTEEAVMLTRIPTLIRVGGRRLVEVECFNDEAVKDLVSVDSD